MLLIDREIVKRDREFPFGRDCRHTFFPIDDRGDVAAFVHDYVLEPEVAVIQGRFVLCRLRVELCRPAPSTAPQLEACWLKRP